MLYEIILPCRRVPTIKGVSLCISLKLFLGPFKQYFFYIIVQLSTQKEGNDKEAIIIKSSTVFHCFAFGHSVGNRVKGNTFYNALCKPFNKTYLASLNLLWYLSQLLDWDSSFSKPRNRHWIMYGLDSKLILGIPLINLGIYNMNGVIISCVLRILVSQNRF